MMTLSKCYSAVIILFLCSGSVGAHHAFAPVYDGAQTISVSGVVTEFNLVNPHATMILESTNQDGEMEIWTVEFDGRLNLTVAGWTDDTISVGERVTTEGNPTHTGSPRMFFTKLVRSDGSELVRPLLERSNAIDDLRRQRAEQRDQQN